MKNLITTVIATSILASSAIVYAAPQRATPTARRVAPSRATVRVVDATPTRRRPLARVRPTIERKKKPVRELAPAPVANRCQELDMNDDQHINSIDRDLFVKGLTHIIQKTLDANGDHYVNVLDLVSNAAHNQREITFFSNRVNKCAESTRRYDFNRDGVLDVRDLVLLRAAGRMNRTLYASLSACIVGEYDYNGDAATNVLDIVNFIQDQMLEQQAFSAAAMAWIQGEAHDIYDINNDSNLDVADAALYIRHYLTCTAGR